MCENQKHHKAVGIWQLQESIPYENNKGKQINDAYTFIYHRDSTVTLRLLTLHKNQWKSKDDIYKLSAKWNGSVLCYLPPFGEWTELAVFENGKFINVGNGIKKIFKLITEEEIIDWNRDIINQRPLHDYQIKANPLEK